MGGSLGFQATELGGKAQARWGTHEDKTLEAKGGQTVKRGQAVKWSIVCGRLSRARSLTRQLGYLTRKVQDIKWRQ
ncbi:unnamed protein product [Linum trigynum]|uniref:Uncharacterized protein n=1 Tax=Linum trigynum TaxID=586398 RepID=A0AAV2FXE3_9ROSI